MELRSGTVVASGSPFTSAEQARAACLGQARLQLTAEHRPPFESAVRGVLQRWTALRLAVVNGWGSEGGEGEGRAGVLEQSILGWFYQSGDHYADELEDHLDEFLREDFNVEAEDGSPGEASRRLPRFAGSFSRHSRRWPTCWCTCSRRAPEATTASRRSSPRRRRSRPSSRASRREDEPLSVVRPSLLRGVCFAGPD